MRLKKIERIDKRNGQRNHPNRDGDEVKNTEADLGMKKDEQQACKGDDDNERIGLRQEQHCVDEVLYNAWAIGMGAQGHVNLFGKNNDPNGGQNPVNDRGMKNIGQAPQLQNPQQGLQGPGNNHGGQNVVKGLAGAVVHDGDAVENNGDDAFCRPVDRDMPPAVEGGDYPTHNGRKNSRHGGRSGGQGNPKRKRQSNQRHTDGSDEIALPVFYQSFESCFG